MTIECKVCGKQVNRLAPAHARMHGMTVAEYKAAYPGAPIVSPELSAKLSAVQQIVQRSPEARARMSDSCSRVQKTPEWNRKNSEGQRGKVIPADVRAKMSAAARRRVERDGVPNQQVPVMPYDVQMVQDVQPVYSPSSFPESVPNFSHLNEKVAFVLYEQLDLCFEREFSFPERKSVLYDFAFPGLKVVLEIQGCRWHFCTEHSYLWQDLPERRRTRKLELDAEKKAYAESQGWVVYQIWEHELLTDEAMFCRLFDVVFPHIEKATGIKHTPD